MRVGVKEALLALGNGFVSHPANSDLRERLTGGQLPLPDFFNELLRLVYRLIFLLAAEDRGLLHAPDAPDTARKLYADGYSLGALRDRAIRRSGWDQFHDRWQGLLIVFHALAHGEPRLGLPALGGLFEPHATPALDQARLSNRALMEAIFRLAWLREDSSIAPVNWRDMETEELGSVYEGLLELTPRLTQDGRGFAFAEGLETKGNERKKTGSYYTPDSLVQALLDSALDPVLDRVESEAQDAATGLLGVTVIDPACGSGHFLLAAARRIATRVARLRTGGVPSAADYRHALRDAVRCCIHGVDRNPMAIELARVALWIETVEPGKPLGFLDANLRVGDSLLGVFDLEALEEGIPDAAYKPLTGDDRGTANDFLKRNRSDKGVRQDIFDFTGGGTRVRKITVPDLATSHRAVRQLPEDTLDEIEAKRAKYRDAHCDSRLTSLEQACDLFVAAFLAPKTKVASLDLHTSSVPTTEDVWKAMRGSTVYGPRLGWARTLVAKARAFHWPLEFPHAIAAGGFDVVLGNPPWEVMQLNEEEYFAQQWPEIAELAGAARKSAIAALQKTRSDIFTEFEAEKRRFEAINEYARSSGRFDRTARGKVNTYALFAELFSSIASPRGRTGIIVPTGISTDATTAPYFASLTDCNALCEIYSFENEEFIFPSVHHAFKFCVLITSKLPVSKATFSFFLRQVDQLNDERRVFELTPQQIAAINPNTKTAPVFRSKFDAQLTAKIYKHIPVLINEGAAEGGNPWDIEFRQGLFNMTSDSDLFRTALQLEEEGYQRDGTDWISSDRQLPSLEQTQGERHVPLYEAKMIHQFDHRWATYVGVESRNAESPEKQNPNWELSPRYWVPQHEVLGRLSSKGWSRDWVMGWRDITNATNERTVIVSFLPRWGIGNKVPLFFPKRTNESSRLNTCLVANFNSLVLDFVARQKIGGTTLNFFLLFQFAILPPAAYSASAIEFISSRVLELAFTSNSISGLARDLGYDGGPFEWDEDRRAHLRSELDAWYARAYGLTRDELRYILDPADVMGPDYPSETFRVLKNNEIRQYGEYRTRRLVLEAWDRMEAGELHAPQPYSAPRSATGSAGQDVNPLFGAGPLFEAVEETC